MSNPPLTLMERMAALELRVRELERQLREYGYPSARIPGRLLKAPGSPPSMMVSPRLKTNWSSPYLLDTEAKVRWANQTLTDGYVPWKLGDSCPFEPPKELSDDDSH